MTRNKRTDTESVLPDSDAETDTSGTATDDPPVTDDRLERHLQLFDTALSRLDAAEAFAKPLLQGEVMRIADLLRQSPEGLAALAARAHRFADAGVFHGGPWENVGRLQTSLVAGSLDAGGVHTTMETFDLLRLAALAEKRSTEEGMNAAQAQAFIDRVLATNLDRVSGQESEANRIVRSAGTDGPEGSDAAVRMLFDWLFEHAASPRLMEAVVDEIEQLAVQRPILTKHIRRMVRRANAIGIQDASTRARLERFVEAIDHPTPLSREYQDDLSAYGTALDDGDSTLLAEEARHAARCLRDTGLGSHHHAVLLRHIVHRHQELVPVALGLDDRGRAEWDAHRNLVVRLVETGVHPGTAQSLYGLARLLERSLLSRKEVREGLERLMDIELDPEVRRGLLEAPSRSDEVLPSEWLLAGALSVLGQPLGVGQGRNPTCQSARGISMWSQHRPGYLLTLVATAARDGHVTMDFLGEHLDSRDLMGGLAQGVVSGLDPVSQVLVPHLDRLYDEMMRIVASRAEDGHRWVNPALYGRIVQSGFASTFARITGEVVDHKEFVRMFLRAFDPDVNGGHRPIYPVPVGIVVTGAHARFLGFHAVALQRVGVDPRGTVRVYFYNPNNEGRQDWGQGIKPMVTGNGELEGESSLPLDDFASRVYAFHHDPFVLNGAGMPDESRVDAVSERARTSWGQAFGWR